MQTNIKKIKLSTILLAKGEHDMYFPVTIDEFNYNITSLIDGNLIYNDNYPGQLEPREYDYQDLFKKRGIYNGIHGYYLPNVVSILAKAYLDQGIDIYSLQKVLDTNLDINGKYTNPTLETYRTLLERKKTCKNHQTTRAQIPLFFNFTDLSQEELIAFMKDLNSIVIANKIDHLQVDDPELPF